MSLNLQSFFFDQTGCQCPANGRMVLLSYTYVVDPVRKTLPILKPVKVWRLRNIYRFSVFLTRLFCEKRYTCMSKILCKQQRYATSSGQLATPLDAIIKNETTILKKSMLDHSVMFNQYLDLAEMEMKHVKDVSKRSSLYKVIDSKWWMQWRNGGKCVNFLNVLLSTVRIIERKDFVWFIVVERRIQRYFSS